MVDDGQIYGDGVNVAALLESLADRVSLLKTPNASKSLEFWDGQP